MNLRKPGHSLGGTCVAILDGGNLFSVYKLPCNPFSMLRCRDLG